MNDHSPFLVGTHHHCADAQRSPALGKGGYAGGEEPTTIALTRNGPPPLERADMPGERIIEIGTGNSEE